MKGYRSLNEYCTIFGLNKKRIKSYFELGLLPDARQKDGEIYIPVWMNKYQRNIIKKTKDVTKRYEAIMKAVRFEKHINYKLCGTTKKKFLSYLMYLVEKDMIRLDDDSHPNRVESYDPTLTLLEKSKDDLYKLAGFIVDSTIKIGEAGIKAMTPPGN